MAVLGDRRFLVSEIPLYRREAARLLPTVTALEGNVLQGFLGHIKKAPTRITALPRGELFIFFKKKVRFFRAFLNIFEKKKRQGL